MLLTIILVLLGLLAFYLFDWTIDFFEKFNTQNPIHHDDAIAGFIHRRFWLFVLCFIKT
jgi:hypothetical protein